MTKSRKSQVAIAVAAASLAGAGAAVAESSHTHAGTLPHGLRAGGPGAMHDDLSIAAAYLGLTDSELRTSLRSGKTMAEVANAIDGKSAAGLIDAIVAAAKKHIAADVSSGRLSKSQADQIVSGLKQHVTDRVDATGPPAGPPGRGGLDAAAVYLGLSESDLQAKLRSGQTLGELADATSGRSKAGLIAALVAGEKSHLDQAVKDGRLTQSQTDGLAATIETRVTDLVNGTLPPRPDGPPPGDGDGHGPPLGPPPA